MLGTVIWTDCWRFRGAYICTKLGMEGMVEERSMDNVSCAVVLGSQPSRDDIGGRRVAFLPLKREMKAIPPTF